jgi:hypothetical protein
VTVLELTLLKEVLNRMVQAAKLVREHLAKAAFEETQQTPFSEEQQKPEKLEVAASHPGWERA